MRVLKFGGTSIGTPERMRSVAELIRSDERTIVVLSAVSGATDALVAYITSSLDRKSEAARAVLHRLRDHHIRYVEGLYLRPETVARGLAIVERHFGALEAMAGDSLTVREERAILAQGELISTALFQIYLEESGRTSVLLDALEFMRLTEEGEPDTISLREHLDRLLAQHPGSPLFVTQGYICRDSFGEISNLKRGGSDYSASLIGAAVGATEIQIWTDIDGMHNNDPRYVRGTQSIRRLSFDEAAELAYFGAKILHPSSILPARQNSIPVRLLNTLDPSAPGTLISDEKSPGEIKAVAAKDGIIAINIRSSRMLLAFGFLRRIFEVFELYKTPIDLVTTSEVAVSVTIDDPTHLDDIIRSLERYGTVDVDRDMSIICVVGDFVAEASGVAARVIESVRRIPLRMISYGGSPHNISLLVSSTLKSSALNALHEGLFHVHT